MELGSHTVAHSKVLNTFPLGTGTERYPALCEVTTKRLQRHGIGRIESEQIPHRALFFPTYRHLVSTGRTLEPLTLPQALVASGYRFSSSATANNSLTHLPYQLTYGRGVESEVGIFEFPVTLEDEELPELGSRLPEALELVRQIGRYGGSFIVLIHPNILGHKLEFERKFVAAVRDRAWFGSVGEFGQWWAARNQVEIDVHQDGSLHTVALDIPDKIKGLALQIPSDWVLKRHDPAQLAVTTGAGHVVLQEVEGQVNLVFEPRPLSANIRAGRL